MRQWSNLECRRVFVQMGTGVSSPFRNELLAEKCVTGRSVHVRRRLSHYLFHHSLPPAVGSLPPPFPLSLSLAFLWLRGWDGWVWGGVGVGVGKEFSSNRHLKWNCQKGVWSRLEQKVFNRASIYTVSLQNLQWGSFLSKHHSCFKIFRFHEARTVRETV